MLKNRENVIWKHNFYFGFGNHGNNLNEKVHNYNKFLL